MIGPHAESLATRRAVRAATAIINAPIIARLQAELRAGMAAAAPATSEYAILDFPNYANIGDSAIYVGEIALCREYFGRDPVMVTEAWNHDLDAVARLDPAVVLLCQGGGNFGDIYPRHQRFREKLVERFPDRKIVFLPQSIHFDDEANLRASAEILSRHPDLLIMVRDEPSRELVERHIGARLSLLPDAAFMLGPITPPIDADLSTLGLLRADKEAVAHDRERPAFCVDWPDEDSRPTMVDRLPRRFRKRLPSRLQGRRPITPAGFEALAWRRTHRGLRLLARGETVLTDRLHAHILLVLLGIPHTVLDNSYGKIERFSSLWTNGARFERA